MSDRFYTPQTLTIGEYTLEGPEAHHLITVRRFQVGDRVTLFNGTGYEYESEVISTSKKTVSFNILVESRIDRELPISLIIAAALPKGDRAEFMIEKLTELGTTRFIPLITSRSVVVPKESTLEKLRRTVIEASKQCGRNLLMQIDPVHKWPDFVMSKAMPSERYLLHPDSKRQQAPLLVQQGIVFAVGPEGGFSTEELDLAQDWKKLNLGPRILRIETAAIAIASMLNSSSI